MKSLRVVLVAVVGVVIGIGGTYGLLRWANPHSDSLTLPLLAPAPSPKPLLVYTIPALQQRQFSVRTLTLESVVDDEPGFTSYTASFSALGKHMTALVNVPKPVPSSASVIVMLRGYVDPTKYVSGTGTKNSARALANAGFVTVAPDFFGYAGSDPEPLDTWQARFEKPLIVAELITSLRAEPLHFPEENRTPLSLTKVGLWGHSNGGQIALTTLEVMREPIPTVLWAPVTAPFPYSILFFSDENADEGKEMRKYVSLFERDYDAFDFSLTQHLDGLRGQIQLHHGTADEAALLSWSQEFLDKIKVENIRREELSATDSTALSPVEVELFTYPNTDHNLQPGWDMVVARTIAFFRTH